MVPSPGIGANSPWYSAGGTARNTQPDINLTGPMELDRALRQETQAHAIVGLVMVFKSRYLSGGYLPPTTSLAMSG